MRYPDYNPYDDNFRDYMDGSVIGNNNANTFHTLLYQDEFEVVNPLGSYRKRHKVLAFYFILGHLRNDCRSQLQSLQLLLLCKSVDVQQFGLNKILQPFIENMKDFENNGIDSVLGLGENIRGHLVFVCGDNLGSHFLGDYSQCFNRNVTRICRFCLASGAEAGRIVKNSYFQRRTPENHQHHLEMIQNDQQYCNVYGLKRDCPLNKLKYFHSSQMLPPDIMHDFLEGIVPSETSRVLQIMVQDELFTLDFLNDIINCLAYGPLDQADKPQEIPNSLLINTNAAHSWCLLRLLPVFIGHMVPSNNMYWEILMMLKDIVDIVFAPIISQRHIATLQVLMQDHHTLFLSLFQDQPLTAKHHFIVHYRKLIEEFGPLIYSWCMRFEAKHYYFKLLSQR